MVPSKPGVVVSVTKEFEMEATVYQKVAEWYSAMMSYLFRPSELSTRSTGRQSVLATLTVPVYVTDIVYVVQKPQYRCKGLATHVGAVTDAVAYWIECDSKHHFNLNTYDIANIHVPNVNEIIK